MLYVNVVDMYQKYLRQSFFSQLNKLNIIYEAAHKVLTTSRINKHYIHSKDKFTLFSTEHNLLIILTNLLRWDYYLLQSEITSYRSNTAVTKGRSSLVI